ncbi:MAG: hypothetical protein JXB47_11390 [Anaerolineae bacterium]|nr:hypothetical protein [Anaerolineae bacterium]
MTLAHALRFTPEDLEANRRGILSERQARAIRRRAALTVARAAVLCVPLFIILALLFNSSGVAGILWALLLSGVPYLVSAVRLWPAVRDANALQVAPAGGYVTAERVRRLGLAPAYYFVVDGQTRFRTDRRACLSFTEGPYTVYYLPTARRVVSIEAG